MENREERSEISEEIDIAQAISEAIGLAEAAGFSRTEQHMIGTDVSELTRNICAYANEVEGTI
jgi:anti-sigma regulatory factor (Ser/Thr protein kinase)